MLGRAMFILRAKKEKTRLANLKEENLIYFIKIQNLLLLPNRKLNGIGMSIPTSDFMFQNGLKENISDMVVNSPPVLKKVTA